MWKVTYVVCIDGAAMLAFLWWLAEGGELERTLATQRRWDMLRAYVMTAARFSGGKRPKADARPVEVAAGRTCTCGAALQPNELWCGNPKCRGFNDSAVGDYAQLLYDAASRYCQMPLGTCSGRLLDQVGGPRDRKQIAQVSLFRADGQGILHFQAAQWGQHYACPGVGVAGMGSTRRPHVCLIATAGTLQFHNGCTAMLRAVMNAHDNSGFSLSAMAAGSRRERRVVGGG